MFIPPPQEAVEDTSLMCPHHQKMKAAVNKNQNARDGTLRTSRPLHAGTKNGRRSTAEPHEALAAKCIHPTQACRMTWIMSTSGHMPQPERRNGS